MKNMQRTAYLIITFVFVSNLAIARVGETLEQCKARYGQPIIQENTHGMYVFIKSGFYIMVGFGVDKKVACISYRKTGKDDLGQPQEITDEEIQIILKLNSNKKWERVLEISFTNKLWTNEDKSYGANYDMLENTLVITNYEFAKKFQDKMKEIDKDKTNGL